MNKHLEFISCLKVEHIIAESLVAKDCILVRKNDRIVKMGCKLKIGG